MLKAQLTLQNVEALRVKHRRYPAEKGRHEFHTLTLLIGDVDIYLFIKPKHIATVLAQLQEVSHHVEN